MIKSLRIRAQFFNSLVMALLAAGVSFYPPASRAEESEAPQAQNLPPGHPKGANTVKSKASKENGKGKRSLLPETHHAGQLQEGPHMNLELVKQTGQIYLYAQSKTGESVPSQKIEMTATYRPLMNEPPIPPPIKDFQNPPPTPTPKKVDPHATPFPETKIILQPDTDHFMAKIDVTVPYLLKVEAKPMGKKTKPDVFEFTVQP